jgi:hypothetical protein
MQQNKKNKKNMKSFIEFIENRNEINDSLIKIYNLVWSRYYPEVMDFFNKISSKDPDVKRLLDEIESKKELRTQEEKDIVSMNVADSNFGNEEF